MLWMFLIIFKLAVCFGQGSEYLCSLLTITLVFDVKYYIGVAISIYIYRATKCVAFLFSDIGNNCHIYKFEKVKR